MEINWHITQDDIKRLKAFVELHDNAFITSRITKNINRQGIQLDRNTILKNLVMCLLTTQQRSGPNTPVGNFLRQNPFPITIETITNNADITQFIRETLQKNGLNRFINEIPRRFVNIYDILKQCEWDFIDNIIIALDGQADNLTERERADEINDRFTGNGFGPKQSRNFLQALGLTKFEIPIDSRISSWFNNFGFPVSLSSKALQDRNYYHLVSDGIQQLCDSSEIYPCVLDAVIFSSFDNGQWTDENND